MVTKKSRRKQIARASARRRADRHQRHETRNRVLQIIGAVLVVVLAAVALISWIVMHGPDNGATSTARVDYDAASVDRNQPLNIEVTR